MCVEELKLQLLAKSSVCPGIITIIWSLITSDVGGDGDSGGGDSDPDDQVIELINNKNFVENLCEQYSKNQSGVAAAKAKLVKPIDLNEDNEGFQEGDQKGTNTSEAQLRQ